MAELDLRNYIGSVALWASENQADRKKVQSHCMSFFLDRLLNVHGYSWSVIVEASFQAQIAVTNTSCVIQAGNQAFKKLHQSGVLDRDVE